MTTDIAATIRETGWARQGTDGTGLCIALAAERAGCVEDRAVAQRITEAVKARWPHRVIPGFVPAFQCHPAWWEVASFNDHPDTTLDDVLSAVR